MSSTIINFESDICPNSDIEKEIEGDNIISHLNKSLDVSEDKQHKIYLNIDKNSHHLEESVDPYNQLRKALIDLYISVKVRKVEKFN